MTSPLRSRRTMKKFVLCFLLASVLFFHIPTALIQEFLHYFTSQWYSGLFQSEIGGTNTSSQGTATLKSHEDPLPLARHRYRPNGLLEVNEDGAHPVYELISSAEKQWEDKCQRASKTLREAVAEYERRYERPPPKGFDLWWKYAIEHDIQLPDEYDQIHNDLEVFYGIEPADLIKIHEENELQHGSYTIGKNDTSEVDLITHVFAEEAYDELMEGTRGIIEMFKEIQNFLPPFRMTISSFDRPNRLTDHKVKAAALEAAAAQNTIEKAILPKRHNLGWVSACSPESLARRKTINLDSPPPRPAKKTFIYNHPLSMDPCSHPDHFYHHGHFLSLNLGPTPQEVLVPQFSYCSTTIHHDIRLPTPHMWHENSYPRNDDPEWDDKVDERLLWRGSTTGIFHSEESRWEASHRDFLVEYANEVEGVLRIISPNRTRNERIGELREVRRARINPAILDIAFSDPIVQCAPTTCEDMKILYPFRDPQSTKEGSYRYVIDVDGNGQSEHFRRLMTSNALVFKATIYPEWYSKRIAPWVHYIPIQIDFSDLHDALVFFRGDANGHGAHVNIARKIAMAGRQWSQKFWRREDMASYLFRLTLEYARVMSTDRDAMSYSAIDSDKR